LKAIHRKGNHHHSIHILESVLNTSPEFPGKDKFLFLYSGRDEHYKEYYTCFATIIHNACYAYCDLSKRALYTFSLDEKYSSATFENKPYRGMFYQTITLGLYPLDIRYAAIHGDRRPVIQVGEVIHKHNISGLRPTIVPLKCLRPKPRRR
jgi:hypothetical protein